MNLPLHNLKNILKTRGHTRVPKNYVNDFSSTLINQNDFPLEGNCQNIWQIDNGFNGVFFNLYSYFKTLMKIVLTFPEKFYILFKMPLWMCLKKYFSSMSNDFGFWLNICVVL